MLVEKAIKRLFLIVFPLSLLFLAFFLNSKYFFRQVQISFVNNEESVFFKSQCPFYLGVSFFSIEEKKIVLEKKNKIPIIDYFLSEKKFKESVKRLKKDFQKEKLSLKKVLFVFPLVLTKDKKWIISKKTFFILPRGERKEISHLTYSEIKKMYKDFNRRKTDIPLRLETVFSSLKNQNFLFDLKGSNRKKILAHLDKDFKDKTRGDMYLFSSNEKLLKEISILSEKWNILHSFKSLLKIQIMDMLYLASFKNLQGQGFVIPLKLSSSMKHLLTFRGQKKLLFFTGDPPFDSFGQMPASSMNALISFKPKQALSIIKNKKPCLIQN